MQAPERHEGGPPPARIRRPEGDAPAALARLPEPPAIPFDLAVSPAVAHEPAPRALELSSSHPYERGTLAAPSRTRGLVELRERLRTPIGMVLVSIAITVADSIYTTTTGELFTLATLRPVWLTAPLALIGVALACWRILDAL